MAGVPWSDAEVDLLAKLTADGFHVGQIVDTLNRRYHKGRAVRSIASVRLKRQNAGITAVHLERVRTPSASAAQEQDVEQITTADGSLDVKANGRRIKTIDELLAHIGADLTRYEVDKSEGGTYETTTKDPGTGKLTTTQMYRLRVRLKPKAGPGILEAVEAVIAGAVKPRTVLPLPKAKGRNADILQALVIADPHIGKYAWSRETGHEDYDIPIATRLLRDSAGELLADGDGRGVGQRAIWLLGDFLHYDTPNGQTTGGTALDRDGRVEKMLEEGAATLFDIIEASAATVPTSVVLVPGNHDAVLTVALRQILSAHFRKDRRVTVDTRATSRKYVEHGRCLIGLTHGDKAKKKLGELMSAEAPEAWGRTALREVHTGHLHSTGAIDSVAGVVIRTAPALCPPDGWHASEGFVGARRGMETFYYHADGRLLGTTVASPDLGAKVRRGVAA